MARLRFVLTLGMLTAIACTVGCGRKQRPRLAVFPVSGQLRVDGRPAGGAEVYFQPRQPIAGLSTTPMAKVDGDGNFAPGTYFAHDGLPAGDYDLLITWPFVRVEAGEELSGPDQLAGRYSNPQYPAAQWTVTEGPNLIPPLDLKSR
jgi:hypothetical protein